MKKLLHKLTGCFFFIRKAFFTDSNVYFQCIICGDRSFLRNPEKPFEHADYDWLANKEPKK